MQLNSESLQKLESLFKAGNYTEVEKQTSDLAKKFPKAFYLFNILGLAQAKQGKFEDAVGNYLRVLANKPDDAQVYCNLAMAQINLGKLQEAIGNCYKALKLNPNLAHLYVTLGAALNNLGKFVEATECYKKALEKSPNDPEINRNIAIAYDNLGEPEKALLHYNAALQQNDSQKADTYFRLGMLYSKLEKTKEAVKSYEQSIESDPKYFESYINLAALQGNENNYDEAIKYYKKALELKPASIMANSGIASAFANQNSYQDAEKYFKKSIELVPDKPELHNRLGNILLKLNKLEEAVECFSKAVAIKSDYAEVYANLGNALEKLGRYDQAKEQYKLSVEHSPDQAFSHYNLGSFIVNFGDPQEAIGHLEKAIEIDPSFVNAYINIGIAHRRQENLDKALEYYQQALELDPSSKNALIHFSEILRILRKINITKGFKRNIIACLQHPDIESIAVSSSSITVLKKDLRLYLDMPWIKPSDLAEMDKVTSGLLSAHIKSALVPDYRFETFLTNVRKAFLEFSSAPEFTPDLKSASQELLEALAFQAFLNEYLWWQDESETEKVSQLKDEILQKINKGAAPEDYDILLLAAYMPLGSIDDIREWALEKFKEKGSSLQEMFKKLIVDVTKEKELSKSIEQLTKIEDEISIEVKKQYEENPYPRWDSISAYYPMNFQRKIEVEVEPNKLGIELDSETAPEVLIAGCGTGKQPITSAMIYEKSNVLAVDLSLASLSYAKRKADELGIKNVKFAQADILRLVETHKQFDIIECVGVLHHMAEPEVGLKTLTGMLKPGAFIKLGFYSEVSRGHIAELRKVVSHKDVTPDVASLREFRNNLQFVHPDIHKQLLTSPDYYSTSTLRDLLLHVQEHRFTLSQIQQLLEKNKLEFLGFVLRDNMVKPTYTKLYTDDPNCTNLKNWEEFEIQNPSIFANMYQFWCRKPSA